jgi:methanogenic corrinoid protein MtbC1
MPAGEMLKEISDIVKPRLKGATSVISKRIGKVVMGTVEGDIHDIGKDIESLGSLLQLNWEKPNSKT